MSPQEASTIIKLLKGNFETLDNEFKKNKKVIILFLNYMYPTESMIRKSDVALLDYMLELQDIYKKFYK